MYQVFCKVTLKFYLKLYYIHTSTQGKFGIFYNSDSPHPASVLSHHIYSGFIL